MTIEVHIDHAGGTLLVGRLYAPEYGASVSFEYVQPWLERQDAFAIDPTALPLRPSPQHSGALFGALQDCGPDRWGRILIERAVRKKLLERKPYRDIDYVLAMDDVGRQGALRFREAAGGPFLAASGGSLPPLLQLSALLRAADAVHCDKETTQDVRFLLGGGSPLGGARPKAAVSLDNGRLAIAKFPKPDDTRDIAAGEVLALALARRAGIRVAEHRLVPIAARHIAVIDRFDRADARRIPFISAASLLGLAPGAIGSYTQLADGIRQFGDDVASDLRELWRRMVFSLLVSNHDDHLRNHGFLMHKPGRWTLSPAYDLNPVPLMDRVTQGSTPISEDQAQPSLALALDVGVRFGMKRAEMDTALEALLHAVNAWRTTGRALRLKAATLDAYESAFDHPLVDEARRWVGK